MSRLLRVLCCPFSVALLGLVGPSQSAAQPPQIAALTPMAVAPGQTVDVVVSGAQLAGISGFWSDLPLTAELAPDVENNGQDKGQVVYRISVPQDAAVGIGGMRVATGQGISNLYLLMIDDLPTVGDAGTNKSLDTAQALELPVAVDGRCEPESSDFYRFDALAGQRVAVEAVARRLGSPLDPVIRLLDAEGRELAYSDDEGGLGADGRFAYEFESDGTYFIEIRDIRYQGDAGHRYRLRIGDFPLATALCPLAATPGTSVRVAVVGPHVAGLEPLEVAMPGDLAGGVLRVSARYPHGQGSAMLLLGAGSSAEQIEFEPNDQPEQASPLVVPGAVSGRFAAPRDRDYYEFQAGEKQRLRFVGRTRSLGSPTDLYLRLYRADGQQLAEAVDVGTEQGAIDFEFPSEGVYRLMVEDLHRRGGPEHAYRIEITPYQPGFSLAVEGERFSSPQGGVWVAKVTSGRRDYNGPITLAVEGLPEGATLAGEVIAEGQNETELRVTMPPSVEAGRWFVARVVGTATVGETTVRAVASTRGTLQGLYSGLPYPPQSLDGQVGIGVGPVFPEFFRLSVDGGAVLVPQLVGAGSIDVRAERMNRFDDAIAVSVEGLPPGFATGEIAPLEKGKDLLSIPLTAPATLAEAEYRVRIVGLATFQNQPQRFVLDDVPLRVVPPLGIGLAPAGQLVAGATQKLKIQLARYGDEPQPVSIVLENLPLGVSAPGELTIPADQSELEIDLTAAADAAIGSFTELIAVATTELQGRRIVVRSAATTLEVTMP